MIRHLAPLLLVAGAAIFQGDANAAIFRITDRSPAPLDGTNITSYPAGTFSAKLNGVSKDFSIVGDFRVETDYLNTSGQTVTGSKKLTAWNITVANTTDLTQVSFTRNMPNMTDNSFTADNVLTNSFTVCLGSNPCDNANQLTLNFADNFNATIGNSVGTASGQSTTLSSLSYTVGSVLATDYSSPLDVQADFVPFGASALAFCPVVILARRFAAKGCDKSVAQS